VHAVLGVALVAVATHLVVWTWPLLGGKVGRWRGARWFAALTFGLYAASFIVGNMLYPVYKVRVRVEYLDEPAALRADAESRAEVRALVELRRTGEKPEIISTDAPNLDRVSRTFDIKEHWVALGLALAAALCALVYAFDARKDLTTPGATVAARAVVALAIAVAACAWIGAIVGLYVSSFRSVGAF